jgi:hypothetical protein
MAEEKSQLQRVRKHLLSGRSITPIDALNLYGCFRLGAIIFELRKEMRIRTDYEDNTRNTGQHARYTYEGPLGSLFDVGEAPIVPAVTHRDDG